MLEKLLGLFREKEDWRLVESFLYQGGIRRGDQEGQLYYHLFESDKGSRKIKPTCTLQDTDDETLQKFAVSTKFYQEKLYRWLVGRADPEINRYADVPQEETMHELKGTIDEKV